MKKSREMGECFMDVAGRKQQNLIYYYVEGKFLSRLLYILKMLSSYSWLDDGRSLALCQSSCQRWLSFDAAHQNNINAMHILSRPGRLFVYNNKPTLFSL